MKSEKGSKRLQAPRAGGFLRILSEENSEQNPSVTSVVRGGGRQERRCTESGCNRQWRLSEEASMTAQAWEGWEEGKDLTGAERLGFTVKKTNESPRSAPTSE